VSQEPEIAVATRSRKVYICWAVGLGVLLAAGVFCWLFVLPVMHMNRLIEDFWYQRHSPDSIHHRKQVVIRALGGPDGAIASLRFYVSCPDWAARRKLLVPDILIECGRPAVPTMTWMLRHNSDARLRRAAAIALWYMESEAVEAVPDMIAALDDPADDVRLYAAVGLSRMGPAARVARPHLQKTWVALSKSSDPNVRRCALEELRRSGQASEGEK